MDKKSVPNCQTHLILDCTSFTNPHFLYPRLDGTHHAVQIAIFEDKDFVPKVTKLIHTVKVSDKDTVICFCDGGRHRSVFIAELLSCIFGGCTNHYKVKVTNPCSFLDGPININCDEIRKFMWY